MFIDVQDLIELKIYYKKDGRSFIAYIESDYMKLKEENKKNYKTVQIGMKPLTWELYNEIQESSWVVDQTGQRKFNYRAYKENRLTKLIVKWDAQKPNEQGEMVPVPVNRETIMSLAPDIAEAILDAYDKVSVMTEDDEKK